MKTENYFLRELTIALLANIHFTYYKIFLVIFLCDIFFSPNDAPSVAQFGHMRWPLTWLEGALCYICGGFNQRSQNLWLRWLVWRHWWFIIFNSQTSHFQDSNFILPVRYTALFELLLLVGHLFVNWFYYFMSWLRLSAETNSIWFIYLAQICQEFMVASSQMSCG